VTSVGTDSVIWPSCEAVRAGLGFIDAFGQQVLPQLSPTAPRPRRSTTGTATGAVTSEAQPSASSTPPTSGSPACGWCRSIRLPARTTATTSPTWWSSRVRETAGRDGACRKATAERSRLCESAWGGAGPGPVQ